MNTHRHIETHRYVSAYITTQDNVYTYSPCVYLNTDVFRVYIYRHIHTCMNIHKNTYADTYMYTHKTHTRITHTYHIHTHARTQTLETTQFNSATLKT